MPTTYFGPAPLFLSGDGSPALGVWLCKAGNGSLVTSPR